MSLDAERNEDILSKFGYLRGVQAHFHSCTIEIQVHLFFEVFLPWFLPIPKALLFHVVSISCPRFRVCVRVQDFPPQSDTHNSYLATDLSEDALIELAF